ALFIEFRVSSGWFFRKFPREGHEDSKPRRCAKYDATIGVNRIRPAIGRGISNPIDGGSTQENPSQVAPPEDQPFFFSIASVSR
ncbi:MAG: hypothetical protein WCI94_18735, partial [Rhodospirillales bacterium]